MDNEIRGCLIQRGFSGLSSSYTAPGANLLHFSLSEFPLVPPWPHEAHTSTLLHSLTFPPKSAYPRLPTVMPASFPLAFRSHFNCNFPEKKSCLISKTVCVPCRRSKSIPSITSLSLETQPAEALSTYALVPHCPGPTAQVPVLASSHPSCVYLMSLVGG